MCPACIATATLIATTAGSTGLAALLVKVLCAKRSGTATGGTFEIRPEGGPTHEG